MINFLEIKRCREFLQVVIVFITILLLVIPVSAKKIKAKGPCLTINGDSIHLVDPFVYEHKGVFYLTGTSDGGNLDGFVYYTSCDLHQWTFRGYLYQKGPGHIGQGSFLAPKVKFYKGRYYLTYSCFAYPEERFLTCLAVSNTPEGPFNDLYTPWFDLGDESAIEADIYVGDDGVPYLYFNENGIEKGVETGRIYGVKLYPDLSGFMGVPELIAEVSQQWEKSDWKKNRCNESPYVIKYKNIYYMTYSAGQRGGEHCGIGVMTAQSPLGPWKKYDDNPIFFTDLSNGISSPCHNCILAKGKKLYMIYHRHFSPNTAKPDFNTIICAEELTIDKNGKLRLK